MSLVAHFVAPEVTRFLLENGDTLLYLRAQANAEELGGDCSCAVHMSIRSTEAQSSTGGGAECLGSPELSDSTLRAEIIISEKHMKELIARIHEPQFPMFIFTVRAFEMNDTERDYFLDTALPMRASVSLNCGDPRL